MSIKQRFDGDATGAVRAMRDLTKAVEQNEKAFEATAKGAKKAETAAGRIKDQIDPQRRYNRKMAELADLVKRGELTLEQAAAQAQRYGRRLEQAGAAGKRAFGSQALNDLKSLALGYFGVQQAISAVNTEIQNRIRLEEESTQTQISLAKATDLVKRNIVTLSKAEQDRALALIPTIAGREELPKSAIAAGVAEALSSTGANVSLTDELVGIAARFLKTEPESIGAFSGSLADISKVTGDQSGLRNLGFLTAVAAQSRVASAQAQAQNIPPALVGITSFGASAEEAGALFSALTNAAADLQGRISGTGGIALAKQIEEFFQPLVEGGKFAPNQVDSLGERINILQGNIELAEEFLSTASFQGKVLGPIQTLIRDPASEVAKQFQGLQSVFGTPEEQIARAKAALEFLGEGAPARLAADERSVSALRERFADIGDRTLTQKSRQDVLDTLTELSGGPLPGLLSRLDLFLTSGPTLSSQELVTILSREIAKLSLRPLEELERQQLEALVDLRNSVISRADPQPAGREE